MGPGKLTSGRARAPFSAEVSLELDLKRKNGNVQVCISVSYFAISCKMLCLP